jgi:hypothetical protein
MDHGRSLGCASLEVVLGGFATRINDTLAGVMLQVEQLDGVIGELTGASGKPAARADHAVDQVVGAVARLRDVVRDVEAVIGDQAADAAETFGAILRLVPPNAEGIALVDDVRGPAPTSVPRRRLARASTLLVRELQEALAGGRGTVTASVASDGGEIAIGVRAEAAHGGAAPRVDGERPAWNEVRETLAEHGGRLAIESDERGFAIELRLPSNA